MQPSYSGYAAANASLRAGQATWDNASPPEDPPEPPDMEREISQLMTGNDTDLISYADFTSEAEQEVLKTLPTGWLTELLIRCQLSRDPRVKNLGEKQRNLMEDIAGRMLDKKWSETNG